MEWYLSVACDGMYVVGERGSGVVFRLLQAVDDEMTRTRRMMIVIGFFDPPLERKLKAKQITYLLLTFPFPFPLPMPCLLCTWVRISP